jgi:hypothetical protein
MSFHSFSVTKPTIQWIGYCVTDSFFSTALFSGLITTVPISCAVGSCSMFCPTVSQITETTRRPR